MSALEELDTPALVVDLDVLESNIAEMAAVAREAGVRLRPHTKTHKSPEIARMQLASGASGVTVAKLGEAEVMADAGVDDLLIAYPLLGDAKLARLRALMERAAVRVSLDSVEVAQGIGQVGTELGRDVPVLVEVDTGLHRLGRPPGAPSAELAVAVAGVQGSTSSACSPMPGTRIAAPTPRSSRRSPNARGWTCSRPPNGAGATGSSFARSAWARRRRRASWRGFPA